MIATAQVKVLGVTPKEAKDKVKGTPFTYFENALQSESGILIFTSGKDYSSLVDKEALASFTIEGKDKVKLTAIEAVS